MNMTDHLPPTSLRVESHTSPRLNQQIRERTDAEAAVRTALCDDVVVVRAAIRADGDRRVRERRSRFVDDPPGDESWR